MEWYLLPAVLILLYAAIAVYIRRKKIRADSIDFYGPIMAVKTARVGFFDWFIRFRRFLRLYGTVGAFMVVVISVLMTVSLFLILPQFFAAPPPPTGIHDPRNILAIPGLNQAIPFTFAVWFGLVVTMIAHEFGHAILARIESMRVKSMGILLAVIPIGAFVEPDEEDVEQAKGMPKIRMFGAGIANNLVLAAICFGLMLFALGYAAPTSAPLVWGYYQDSPAERAGVPLLGIVEEINGVPVSTINESFQALESYSAGDEVAFVIRKDGSSETCLLRLEEWPENMSGRSPLYTGIIYYDSASVRRTIDLLQGTGILLPFFLLAVPLNVFLEGNTAGLGILVIDSPEAIAWSVPFPGVFWLIVQVLFWSGWFNIAVGVFNALPLVPLDGGFIMKEGVERLFERRGWTRFAPHVVAAISGIVAFALAAIIALPLLSQLLR